MKDEATTDYEYMVTEVESGWTSASPQAIEDTLNEETEGEWEYVDILSTGADNLEVLVIFRKPV